MNKKIAFIIALLTIGLASRFIPHYPNFTAIGSMAILGGAMLRKPLEAILLPVGVLFLSDLIINNVMYASESFTLFYQGAIYIYAAVVLSVLASRFISKLNTKSFLVLSLASSILFFLISNYGVWATGTMYPKTTAGLMAAYEFALPYGLSHLAGTLVYGVAIMGFYQVLVGERKTEFVKI